MVEEDIDLDELEEPAPATRKRERGRAKKTAPEVVQEVAQEEPKKQRGRPKGSTMSAEAAAEMTAQRDRHRKVNVYLVALSDSSAKKRGRPKSPDVLQQKISDSEIKMKSAVGTKRLQLTQDLRKLKTELAELQKPEQEVDIFDALRDFIEVAARYGEDHDIEYQSWRDMGVPADVLKDANIAR